MADVKFCGLTRPEDARAAVGLGAAYVGVIFAEGPRLLTKVAAAAVLHDVPAGVRRVGVFADQTVEEIADYVAAVPLDAVQLHAPRAPRELDVVRRAVRADVWAVVRVADGVLPADYRDVAAAADALVIDSLAPGQLGGTGVATDWTALARALERAGRPRRLVLAGGLRPENVHRAIALVEPDVVDVSSGVEARPGVKDHERMAAFAAAAGAANSDSRQTA